MLAVAPRSTWIHCGSLKALDQRVPAVPSVASVAALGAFSAGEAVVGLPCDSRGPAALAEPMVTAMYPASMAATASTLTSRRRRGDMVLDGMGMRAAPWAWM